MLPALRNNSFMPTTLGQPVNRLTSLFDRFFNDDFFVPFAPLTTTPGWSALPLSLWEDEQNVYVEVDAPGVTDRDIEVAVQEGNLIIRGERKCERQQGSYDTRSYGRFEQHIHLPTPVNTEQVEAKLTNGVLSVRLPKSEAARPRKIALKTE
jgi:HSP20 family protein